jgi:peptide/nickel transport system substrate-binding protein
LLLTRARIEDCKHSFTRGGGAAVISRTKETDMSSETEGFMGPEMTRQQVLKAGAGAAAVVSMGSLIAACGGDDDKKDSTAKGSPATGRDEPKRGGTLLLGFNQSASKAKIDPALSTYAADEIFGAAVFERLTTQEDFKAKPVLAERWEGDKAAKVWTFFLRPGVKFSDGTPLTAKDVKFTITRVLDESLGSGGYSRLAQSLAPDGIEAVDDQTIKFNLKQADALFPFVMGARHYGILKDGTPKEVTVENGIGTGPFKIKSFAPGRSFEVVRNENYWQKDLPYLDGMRGTFYGQASSLAQAVAAGTVHITDPIAAAAVKSVEGNDNVAKLELEGSISYDIAMDETKAPFDKPQVLQAFKLAINRDQVLETAFGGIGNTTGDVPALPSDAFYPKEIGVPEQDAEQAKALLAEAGHPDGVDVELFTSEAIANGISMATAFAEQAKAAGIRIKVKQWPAASYYDEVWLKKSHYIDIWNRRHPLDAMATFCVSSAAWNEAKFTNKEFDDLVIKALGTVDEAEREKLTTDALTLLAQESGYIIPLLTSKLYLQDKKVRDAKPTYDTTLEVGEAWLDV